MGKLELKHLAPYLPYNLKVLDTIKIKNKLMNTGQGSSNHWVGIKTVLNYNDGHKFIYKPILRPINDSIKEINSFILLNYVDWLEDTYPTLNLHNQLNQLVEDDRWVNHCDYLLIQHLLEWHFDIFGLIEKGLAIDINTI